MTMTLAQTFLLLVSALALLLAGCNTKATKSSENAEGVAAESVPAVAPPMNFDEALPKVYALSQLPLARSELDIRCQQQVRDLYVSFVGIKEGGIFVVVLTKSEFGNPGENLYTHTPRDGLPEGATLDWGYALDRNFDGSIDYLAILDGLNPVVPDNWEGELPNLRRGPEHLTDRILKEIVYPNTRLLYWHIADDNFDGDHDSAAASTRNLNSGWIDGWMVAQDRNFDGLYDLCKVFRGQFRTELGNCSVDSTGFVAPDREPSGLRPFPPARDHWVFALINEGAEKCSLSGADFRSARK
jgi:hypothetical protein